MRMNAVSLTAVEELSDDERRALRASRFGGASGLQPLTREAPKAKRLAHPGGPVVTNKAAALARFLKRKLQDPEGFAALDPELVEKAVKAAKTGKTTQAPGVAGPDQRNDEDSNGSEDDEKSRNPKTKAKSIKDKKLSNNVILNSSQNKKDDRELKVKKKKKKRRKAAI
ncbi:hypothetical protein KFL_000060810 [Klebsormidium nitens]|uniref:Uncharacterized protein n=1 Tax=Klebsormidium nitens TaxID=105231 RepID=A0A0U9HHW3_KLENI|nr:hypothetical protein KFL_000060810 [Klebsormidium nitens]|eukprot:GAQ78014.1 hypothetical protein KFL_000060810 [Klebsormidium nitens]